MKLSHITVTGIDDHVHLKWVEEIAAASYPHLEFGVLLSQKRKGSPRYPSPNWLSSFLEHFVDSDSVGVFSAHLCGVLSDHVTDQHKSFFTRGDYFGGPPLSAVFDRIQLNGFPESHQTVSEINMFAASLRETTDIILPVPDQKTLERVAATFMMNVHFLHDRSRGRGISPKTWPCKLPAHHQPNVLGEKTSEQRPFTGFAGGINPENIRKVLDELCGRKDDRPFWIDLETGARTDDRLDTSKVGQMLKVAKEYIIDDDRS